MELSGKLSLYMHNPHDAESRKIAVSKKLQELRRTARLTQKDVCEIIHVTPQTYSGYEKGKYEPTMETIVRLAMLYDVSTDHILCNWIDDCDEGSSYYENIVDNEQIKNLWLEVELMRQDLAELKKQSAEK